MVHNGGMLRIVGYDDDDGMMLLRRNGRRNGMDGE